MYGNVNEWCHNRFLSYDSEKADDTADEVDLDDSVSRVLRGGSYVLSTRSLRSGYRIGGRPVSRIYGNGFRVARTFTP